MDKEQKQPTTLGEFRVRTQFNPDNNGYVDDMKQSVARLINICSAAMVQDPRLANLAMDAFEEAAMWAVKLLTAQAPGAQAGGNMPTTNGPTGPKID